MASGINAAKFGEKLLILLIGSNPLPNYLSACALRPDAVAFVYTTETKNAKDRVKYTVTKVLGSELACIDAFVEDATDATSVRRAIDAVYQGARSQNSQRTVTLNYTGGTKVMAAQARLAFQQQAGQPQHASYLDEGSGDRQPRLRFDDGTSTLLADFSNVPLDLETILYLHKIDFTPREPKEPAPTSEDADSILREVLRDVSLASRMYNERVRLEKIKNPRNAAADPFVAARHGIALSQAVFPTDEQLGGLGGKDDRERWYKHWYSFVGGEWLEPWVAEQIRRLDLEPEPEITVGVDGWRGSEKTQLEVDVAVVRGHRSYFISCTTDTSKGLCKSKLFEIAVRSRHLGGDLARAALVCLADEATVAKLQRDIDDVWGASNTTKVFGLANIRKWRGCDGAPANHHDLRAWLES